MANPKVAKVLENVKSEWAHKWAGEEKYQKWPNHLKVYDMDAAESIPLKVKIVKDNPRVRPSVDIMPEEYRQVVVKAMQTIGEIAFHKGDMDEVEWMWKWMKKYALGRFDQLSEALNTELD